MNKHITYITHRSQRFTTIQTFTMLTKLTVAGVVNAHTQELNKLITVAKATEATHKGLGRRKKEGRTTVTPAASKKLAEARKKKKKEKERHRERSRERTTTRHASKSCKEGFVSQKVLEAQGGILDVLGTGDVASAIEGLRSQVAGLEGEAGGMSSALADLARVASTIDVDSMNSLGGKIEGLTGSVKDGVLPLAEKLVKLLEIFEERTDPKKIASTLLPSCLAQS